MSNQKTAHDGVTPETESDPLTKSERELDMAISELRGEPAGQPEPAQDSPELEVDDEISTPDHPLRRTTDNSIIMSIPVSVDVVLGTTEMPVHQLMALKKGTTVTLDRRIGEPVDVVVSGRRIARGEIVVLDDDSTRFGIKLTEVVES